MRGVLKDPTNLKVLLVAIRSYRYLLYHTYIFNP